MRGVYVPLVEFLYLVFTHMPGESYRRRLRSSLLYLCYVFQAKFNSLVSSFCTSALGLVLFQIRVHSIKLMRCLLDTWCVSLGPLSIIVAVCLFDITETLLMPRVHLTHCDCYDHLTERCVMTTWHNWGLMSTLHNWCLMSISHNRCLMFTWHYRCLRYTWYNWCVMTTWHNWWFISTWF